MTFLSKFPTTTFNLPDGSSIESVNFLKTFYFSDSTINNDQIVSRKFGVSTNKIENLSYELYGDKPSLYWITLYLNNIDSFTTAPVRQTKFESNLPTRYPGKVYYIKEGRDIPNILPGDIVNLSTGSDGTETWKAAGVVKEYDKKFRRIVIHKEYQNEDNTASFPGNSDTFYDVTLETLRKNGDSWEPVYDSDTSGITIGKVENEVDKILGMYSGDLNSREISPYYVFEGSGFDGVCYDFSTGPTSGSAIYKLSSQDGVPSDLSSAFLDTIKTSEIRKNTKANSIKMFSTERAFQVNTFIVDLLKTEFKRGRVITVT
mgnify:CR=1 FL=1